MEGNKKSPKDYLYKLDENFSEKSFSESIMTGFFVQMYIARSHRMMFLFCDINSKIDESVAPKKIQTCPSNSLGLTSTLQK